MPVLGIDVGSTNTKAVLAEVGPVTDGSGGLVRALRWASRPTPSDADALLALVVDLVREVLDGQRVRPEAIGVASMAETGVPLAADGRPLTPLLRWDGNRAAAEALALERRHGRAELFAATGVRPSAKVPLATWAWLGAHHPAVLAGMAGWAGAADVVALALSGALVTDHTLAGRTMAYRLPEVGAPPAPAFDAGLLATVGVRTDQVPRVAGPSSRGPGLGQVTTGLARHWTTTSRAVQDAGVPRGTPVVVAGHDHAVGTWAAGVRAPGDRGDSVGTAEAVLTVLDRRPDPSAVAAAGMSLVRTVGGRYDALLAGSSSAGAMLSRLREAGPRSDLSDVLAAALADMVADPAPTGVLVLPYLSGRQTPAPDPTARVRVLPETAPGPRLTRAVLEGLCLQARWMLAAQRDLAAGEKRAAADRSNAADGLTLGAEHPLTVLGGPVGAHSAWGRTKARVTPEPLRWVLAEEPVALGAALLAATRSGLLGDPDVLMAGTAPDAAPVLPASTSGPERPRAYDSTFTRFVAAALGAATDR